MYEKLGYKDLDISYCDFKNTDLSNNKFDANFGNIGKRDDWRGAVWITSCDFSNTGITIDFVNCPGIRIFDTDLSGLDYSKSTITEEYFKDLQDYAFFGSVNFSNTGLNIAIPFDEEAGCFVHGFIESDINKDYDNGYFNGCYVNGKGVGVTPKGSEKPMIYVKGGSEYFRSVLDSINRQMIGEEKK